MSPSLPSAAKIFLMTAFAAVSGAAFLGYIYYSVQTGGAFVSFDAWCKHSRSVARVVGKFEGAKLAFIASTTYVKEKGDVGEAGFKAHINGSKSNVDADVKMIMKSNIWLVKCQVPLGCRRA